MMNWLRSTALAGSTAEPRRVILIGESKAGKTSILNQLKLKKFEKVTGMLKCLPFPLEDGTERLRDLRVHYYENIEGMVFVIDGSDPDSFPIAAETLRSVLLHNDMRGVPMLVLVNKNDVPSCVSLRTVREELELQAVNDRLWDIRTCSSLTGDGLTSGFQELARMMKYFPRAG